MRGDSFVARGVYLVREDGHAAYSFLEEDIGDRAPVEDVIEALKAAVKGEDFVAVPYDLVGVPAGNSSCRMSWKQWASGTSGPE